MTIEISIRMSTEDKRMTKKVLDYSGEVVLSSENEFMQSLIQEGVKEFGQQPDDVVITCKMTV